MISIEWLHWVVKWFNRYLFFAFNWVNDTWLKKKMKEKWAWEIVDSAFLSLEYFVCSIIIELKIVYKNCMWEACDSSNNPILHLQFTHKNKRFKVITKNLWMSSRRQKKISIIRKRSIDLLNISSWLMYINFERIFLYEICERFFFVCKPIKCLDYLLI